MATRNLPLIASDDRRILGGLLLLSAGQSLAVLVPAWAVKQLFDQALRHSTKPVPIPVLLAWFVGSTLVVIAIEVFRRRIAAELAIRHAASIRSALFRRRLEGSRSVPTKGNLLLPFVGDLTAARRWMSEGLARAVSAAVLIPVVVGIIAWSSPLLAASLGIALAVSLAASTMLLNPLDRAVRDVRSLRGALTSFLTGRLLAADVVRSAGRVGLEVAKADRRTWKLADAERRRAWAVGGTRGAARFTTGALLLATLFTGAHEVAAGRLSPGSVAAILTLVGLLSQGVEDLARAIELWKPAKVAYERIDRILGTKTKFRATPAPRDVEMPGGLYIASLKCAGLAPISDLGVPARSVILLDGDNAAGKSALLSALAFPRMGDVSILVDGKRLASVGERTRARLVGYARNGLPILPGSLRFNLDYRGSGATTEQIDRLASLCGLDRFVERLPGGMATRIREDSEMSGSELAAIALVRALAGNPPLLLLDAIDAELDPEIMDRVAPFLAQRDGVTIIVTRKPRWRAIATQRWLISNGSVAFDMPLPPGEILPFRKAKQ